MVTQQIATKWTLIKSMVTIEVLPGRRPGQCLSNHPHRRSVRRLLSEGCCWLLVLLVFGAGLTTTVEAQQVQSDVSQDQTVSSPACSRLKDLPRSEFASDASHVVGTFDATQAKHDPTSMAQAGQAFLDSLDAPQRKRAQLTLQDRERRQWTNLPAPRNAGGVRLGDLDQKQVKLACHLMASLFSEHGFRKIRDIMLADDQLLRDKRPRPGFGTENFSIVIFAKPSPTERWAFQVDGHHVGINLAIEGDQVALSPSFIGTQPHKFQLGGAEFQPFARETDLAHKLVQNFDDEQIRKAVLGPQRGRVLTGPGKDGLVPPPKGMNCNALTPSQRATMLQLISQWVNDLPAPQATKRMREIEQELGQMTFSWNGNKRLGSDISYRIQSPSLIIEYACQDLGGNPLDHLHSMYRNPKNEYGKQLDSK